MDRYTQQIESANSTSLKDKAFLTIAEGAEYTSLGRTYFRQWAEQIGSKRKIGRRVIYDRSVIDQALKRGDAI